MSEQTTTKTATPAMAAALHLKDAGGVLIGDVTPGTPAAHAGLQRGDVVLDVDGQKLEDSNQLRMKISLTPPGTTVNMRVMHERPLSVLTDAYPEAEYFADLMRVTGGATNEALARLTISRSTEAFEWVEARGVQFQPSLSGTLGLSATNAFFLGGGKALLNALYNTAARLGVEVVDDAEFLQVATGAVDELDVVLSTAQDNYRHRGLRHCWKLRVLAREPQFKERLAGSEGRESQTP